MQTQSSTDAFDTVIRYMRRLCICSAAQQCPAPTTVRDSNPKDPFIHVQYVERTPTVCTCVHSMCTIPSAIR